LNPNTANLVKMTCGLEKATTPHKVAKPFKAAGIWIQFSELRNAVLDMVDRDAAKKVPHWDRARKRIPALTERGGFKAGGYDADRWA
jgi:hypothetical protein